MPKIDLDHLFEQQREQLDHVEMVPQEAMWQGIRQDLDRRARIRRFSWSVAAAIAVLAIALPFVHTTTETSAQRVAQVYPEWAEEEETYLQLISDKKTEIGFDSIQMDRFPNLAEQLADLEEDFTESLVDLARHDRKEDVIRVLIRYHERQLNILEKIANESNRPTKKEFQHDDILY